MLYAGLDLSRHRLDVHLDGCAGTTVLTVLRGRGRTWLGVRHRSEPPIGRFRMP
jgi:hypothetical protein